MKSNYSEEWSTAFTTFSKESKGIKMIKSPALHFLFEYGSMIAYFKIWDLN